MRICSVRTQQLCKGWGGLRFHGGCSEGGGRGNRGGLLSPDDDDFSGVTVGDMGKVGGANPKFIGEPTSWWRSDSPARARNGSKGSQAGTLARTAQPGTHALRCQRELVVKKPGPSGVRAMPGSGRRRAEKTSGRGSGSEASNSEVIIHVAWNCRVRGIGGDEEKEGRGEFRG